jgi:hypothetical protein
MISRPVSWPRFMHTGRRVPHKVRPTAHCICSRSGASRNLLNNKQKAAWLFFDQVNNYAKFRRGSRLGRMPSTDLSTVIVDKYVQ